MSNQKICDLCGEIIVDKIFYTSITECVLPKQDNKMVEFVTLEKAFSIMQKRQQENAKNTNHFEMCKECKKVLDYLLVMRVDNLRLLKNDVNGILSLPLKKDGEK